MAESNLPGREVFIVDGARTPYLKARGKPGPFAAADLAVYAGRALLARQPFSPDELDEVIFGCVAPAADEANVARIIALRMECGRSMPAWTVQRNCASGMQALDSAAKDIASGRHELVLAGGCEAMSRAPLLYNDAAVNWFSQWMRAKTLTQRLQLVTKFRPHFFAPVISLVKGLTDPVVGMNMGQTAEKVAARFGITREQMDAFALRSHQRAAKGQESGAFSGLVPLYDEKGNVYDRDDGVRNDSSMEKLAKLKPFFDKKFGLVTAANSSQVTDGAVAMILASAEAVKKYNLPVMGKIVDVQWAALEPEEMGLGPVFASTPIMQRHNLQLSDIDYWEINEAFAAQVLGCIAAWQDEKYCQERLGLDKALGKLDEERLNVYGGAVAIGHPVGSSGARIVLRLLHVLRENNAKRGIASICIGGGQGGSMLIETVD